MRGKGSAELEAFALPLTLALSPHACGERGDKLDLVYDVIRDPPIHPELIIG
jgi:hypothetical protein